MSFPSMTAAAKGFANCQLCGTLQVLPQDYRCRVCRAELHLRKPYSVQRSLALLITAAAFYIPANVLPIMWTEKLGHISSSTIIGGVVTLWSHGSYPIAFIIFFASIVVPILKMLVLAWLCWVSTRPGAIDKRKSSLLYVTTEYIGKWSMVDVFVVALLSALIQLDGLLTVRPGSATIAFALLVIASVL